MTNQAASASFTDRAKALFRKGMRHHVVATKGDRKYLDVPVNLVLLVALLAIWVVAIMWVLGMLTGFDIRVVDTELEEEPQLPTDLVPQPEPGSTEAGGAPDALGEETL